MSTIKVSIEENIATLTLVRGKVNSINETLIDDFSKSLDQLSSDANVDAVILTGRDKFFSFGFDVPELLTLSPYRAIKQLTRGTLDATIALGEKVALDAFIETWYTDQAQQILRTLVIR